MLICTKSHADEKICVFRMTFLCYNRKKKSSILEKQTAFSLMPRNERRIPMTENMNKVLELLEKKPELKEKVLTALKSLSKEADLETVLNDVLGPVGREAGVQLTAEDVKELADSVPEDEKLSPDDLTDVNGGLFFGIIPLVEKAIKGIVNVVNTFNNKPKPVKSHDQWKDKEIF